MKLLVVVGAVVAIAAGAFATILVTDGTDTATIAQPRLDRLNLRTRNRLAPASRRVDLTVPSFSHPTNITNPLFPIGTLRSAVLVGRYEGKPWRAETTLLPGSKTIEWNGRRIATLRSQFVAYLDGRIYEVAVDRYAQADDGSVWYFGEDAFSYQRGVVADTEGTWLAGVNGPPAMIMPGGPRVGDVYRTENIPGLVFEEVTVRRLGATLNGPSGPVHGVLIARELHMDESRLEDKVFAPGYGEFHSGAGRTFEATALAIPADARPGPVPPQLQAISRAAKRGLNARSLTAMDRAWAVLRRADVPARLADEMNQALAEAKDAVKAQRARLAAVAALHVLNASLDLQLRHRPVAEIDRARLALLARQLLLDARAHDVAAVRGDRATLAWIRERLEPPR